MTTVEALAVVREALAYAPFNESEHIRHPAYSALALIEERLREWERMEERWHSVESKVLMHDDALARAEKAEAERDELLKRVPEVKDAHDHWKSRAVAAEQRVAELEAALRAYEDDSLTEDEFRALARRALGGGEE